MCALCVTLHLTINLILRVTLHRPALEFAREPPTGTPCFYFVEGGQFLKMQHCDPDCITDCLLVYDHKKVNCLNFLETTKAEAEHSLRNVQNGKRKIDGVHTKLQCIKKFKSHIDSLSKKFERTTCQQEGGPAFAEDVLKLELNMNWVLKHGWEGVFEIVKFPRLKL